jgi:hypothetical protein
VQRVMATKLGTEFRRYLYYGSQWHKAVLLAVLGSSGKFVNFWICLFICKATSRAQVVKSPLTWCSIWGPDGMDT